MIMNCLIEREIYSLLPGRTSRHYPNVRLGNDEMYVWVMGFMNG